MDRYIAGVKLKKLLNTLTVLGLVIVTVCSGILPPAQSRLYGATEVQVSIVAPQNVTQNSDFVVKVNISQVADFDACQFDISFDTALLRLDNVTAGQIGSTSIPVDIWNQKRDSNQQPIPGTYIVVQNMPGLPGVDAGTSSVTGSGYLAELHFRVIGSPGANSNINLSNGVISNTLAQEIVATWTGASVHIAAYVSEVLRDVPASAAKGQTFNVNIAFSAPDNLSVVGLSDFVPAGWNVQVDTAWCTPAANESSTPASNNPRYTWSSLNQGTAVTAVYKVSVPADATPGVYQFTNGTLQYSVGQMGPFTVNIGGKSQVELVEGARIQGDTWDAKGGITPPGVLGGVTVTLDGIASVISDAQGVYQLTALATGTHTLVASKTGFRSYTRTITVTNLGDVYTLKFKGIYGLIPNAPTLTYVLNCINKWKFPPEADPEQGLNLTKVLSAINAWKFPKVITLSPTSGAAGTVITVTGSNFSANTAGDIWFDTNGNGIKDTGEPQVSMTTTATGAIPAGVTLTVPSVAAATYQVCVDIPSGSTIEVIANFTLTP